MDEMIWMEQVDGFTWRVGESTWAGEVKQIVETDDYVEAICKKMPDGAKVVVKVPRLRVALVYCERKEVGLS